MKSIIFGLALLCCSIAVQAQTISQDARLTTEEDFEATNVTGFGLKGGVSFSRVYGTRDINAKNHTGFLVGAFYKKALSNKFAFQPELVYTSRGSGYEIGGKEKPNCLRMEYLDLPVLLVFYVFDNVSVHLGPQASLLMGLRHNQEAVSRDGFQTVDFSGVGGLEAKVYFLRLGARYNLGLRNLINKPAAANEEVFKKDSGLNEDNLKNATLQLYISVGFPR